MDREPWRKPVPTPQKEGRNPPCLQGSSPRSGRRWSHCYHRRRPDPHQRGRPPRRPRPGRGHRERPDRPAFRHGDRDINDVYVFRAPDNANRTVIAMTVNPAINLFGGNFGTNVRYIFNIDKNGDERADLAYVARFGRVDRNDDDKFPEQDYRIEKYTGSDARSIDDGTTVAWGESNEGNARTRNSLRAWAESVRSVLLRPDRVHRHDHEAHHRYSGRRRRARQQPDRLLQEPQHQRDRAVRPELAAAQHHRRLGDHAVPEGRPLALWRPDGSPGDQHGLQPDRRQGPVQPDPAESSGDGLRRQVPQERGQWPEFFSSLDSEGAYSNAQAGALADVLIPDVLVYSRSSKLPAPLNGRALADDVIDVELNVTTGGDPLGLFANRDATGAVPSDGVGPHTDYLARFPYLGKPH